MNHTWLWYSFCTVSKMWDAHNCLYNHLSLRGSIPESTHSNVRISFSSSHSPFLANLYIAFGIEFKDGRVFRKVFFFRKYRFLWLALWQVKRKTVNSFMRCAYVISIRLIPISHSNRWRGKSLKRWIRYTSWHFITFRSPMFSSWAIMAPLHCTTNIYKIFFFIRGHSSLS